MKMRALTLMALFLGVSFVRRAVAQQSSSSTTYHSIQEALRALKTSKDENEKKRIYQNFQQVPILDHDDLLALHAEARSRQDNTPTLAPGSEFDAYVRNGQAIAARLHDATGAAFQDDIAALIDREAKSLATDTDIPLAPLGKMDLKIAAKSAVRLVRVHALLDAAGDGKNEKARAALWRMVDVAHDSYFGQVAIANIGKLGHAEDVDRVIQMVEANPRLGLPFSGFGDVAVPRLLGEIRKTSLPDRTQARIALGLVEVSSHDNLSTFVPLIHDGNKHIANAALDAIGLHLQNGDEQLIQTMLKDPSMYVRVKAINAIDGRAWDPRYVPSLIYVLKNDPDLSSVAARYLGHHKVRAAIPALQEALKSANPHVKGAAAKALDDINHN